MHHMPVSPVNRVGNQPSTLLDSWWNLEEQEGCVMSIGSSAASVVGNSASAAVGAVGAVGGATAGAVLGASRGLASGAVAGASAGAKSNTAAVIGLAAVGATGIVVWPVLIAIGGSALALRQLSQHTPGDESPARATAEKHSGRGTSKSTRAKAPAKKTGSTRSPRR